MSVRGQEATNAGSGTAPAQAYYVYAIGDREGLERLFGRRLPEPLEEATGLELIVEGELAAVVSPVPVEVYGEEGLAARVENTDWITARALSHERVVGHLAERTAVIPLRFGAIYLERGNVEQALSSNRARFTPLLERLAGCDEWFLNAYVDQAKATSYVERASPALREALERASGASPGQAYLMRRKLDGLRESEVLAHVRVRAADLGERVRPLCREAVRVRPPRGRPGEGPEVAARVACLVKRERLPEFRGAVEGLARELGAEGLSLELVGPSPAYTFSSILGSNGEGADA